MSRSKSAGTNPLGHSPFGKESLEGPKVHHDFHGNDDSRPAKGNAPAVPNKHWETLYNPREPRMGRPESAWDPRQAKNRAKLYDKVNETDH